MQKNKETWLGDALQIYEKRLKSNMQIEWLLFEKEEDLIKNSLEQPNLIALDVKGKLLSSVLLSQKLFNLWGTRISFVIGGPTGLPSQVLEKSSFQWSFSPLTFTHQIIRLLLVEQLYRAIEIEKKSPYHK